MLSQHSRTCASLHSFRHFRCCAVIESIPYLTNRGAIDSGYCITLFPPVVIQNLLPMTLQFRMQPADIDEEHELPSGAKLVRINLVF